MDKKRKIVLLISLIILFVIMAIGSSYALWTAAASQEGYNVVVTDCFDVTLTGTNDISLENNYPVTNSAGLRQTPYNFKIKNICNTTMNYYLNLEMLNGTTLPVQYLNFSLNGTTVQSLGEKDNSNAYINKNVMSSKVLEHGVLHANQEKEYNLRLWIDENATNEDVGFTYFASKIVVVTMLSVSIDELLDDGIIAYNPMGGTLEREMDYLVDGKVENPPIPTRDGYEFLGWYTQETDGTLATSETVLNSGDTLYARWIQNPYTITYDLDGGTLANANPTSFNENSNFTLNNPTKAGFRFTGWTEQIVDLGWTSGWIDVNNGSIGGTNNSYPNAVYSDYFFAKAGVTYKVVDLDTLGEKYFRIRNYNLSGEYMGYIDGISYTPSEDYYSRILYIKSTTEEQRANMKVEVGDLKETASITPNTNGNRKFIANYERQYSLEKVYEGGSTSGDEEVYSTPGEVVLLDFDSSIAEVPSLFLDLKCGNENASGSSTCKFYIDGYTNGQWEELFVKSGKRSHRTAISNIFEGDELLTTNINYSKFRIRFSSTGNETYLYAKIKL